MPILAQDVPVGPMSTTRPNDAFQQLVFEINRVLGPSSGIDSADIDPRELEELMRAYESNQKEWHRYAWADKSRNYTRNLVDKGNGKANLVRDLVAMLRLKSRD